MAKLPKNLRLKQLLLLLLLLFVPMTHSHYFYYEFVCLYGPKKRERGRVILMDCRGLPSPLYLFRAATATNCLVCAGLCVSFFYAQDPLLEVLAVLNMMCIQRER